MRTISVSLKAHIHYISKAKQQSSSWVLFLSIIFVHVFWWNMDTFIANSRSLWPYLSELFLQTHGENKVSFEILQLNFCTKFILQIITSDLSKIEVWTYLCLKSFKAPHVFLEKFWILTFSDL